MSDPTHANLMLTALLTPLAGAALVLTLGPLARRFAGVLAASLAGFAALMCVIALIGWTTGPSPADRVILIQLPWIPVAGGWMDLGLMIDSLTVAMATLVSVVAAAVQVYSIGYMRNDPRRHWFFIELQLFVFSMMGIVLANSLIMIFVFWELVGLSSYLLIGFWFERRGPQRACFKAFVMNRIGDAGFLLGIGLLVAHVGPAVLLSPAAEMGLFQSLASQLGAATIAGVDGEPPLWLTVAGIALFCGAVGKSAQFPLHTWLPDAMEGPTPVSSIVHSATMVAAGVYLTARLTPIFTPTAQLVVAVIGAITLLLAAVLAMVAVDIKRVLAYSTLSQLGYMVLAVGVGGYVFALYHLIVHALFKCALFQCAGSVIEATHHEQDMRRYGGLWRKMPWTAATYGVAMLAISGAAIPFTLIGLGGFYSKDGILAAVFNYGSWAEHLGPLRLFLIWAPIVTAYLTPLYMARSFAMTFLGEPRVRPIHDHAREAPGLMRWPALGLTALSVIAVPVIWPGWQTVVEHTSQFAALQGVMGLQSVHQVHAAEHAIAVRLLFGLAPIAMIALGLWLWLPGPARFERVAATPVGRGFRRWAEGKFHYDELYDRVITGASILAARLAGAIDRYLVDGMVNLAGAVGRRLAMGVGLVDRRVVDGAVAAVATAARGGGRVVRGAQVGQLRMYVMILLVVVTTAALVLVVAVVGGG